MTCLVCVNVLADTSPEPSENFDHAEHTPKPIHEEIDSEAPRRRKRPKTAKSFGGFHYLSRG
jgi:hypothetical protein